MLDHKTRIYKVNFVDKLGLSILKEAREDSCTIKPSLAEDVVFNPNYYCCML